MCNVKRLFSFLRREGGGECGYLDSTPKSGTSCNSCLSNTCAKGGERGGGGVEEREWPIWSFDWHYRKVAVLITTLTKSKERKRANGSRFRNKLGPAQRVATRSESLTVARQLLLRNTARECSTCTVSYEDQYPGTDQYHVAYLSRRIRSTGLSRLGLSLFSDRDSRFV